MMMKAVTESEADAIYDQARSLDDDRKIWQCFCDIEQNPENSELDRDEILKKFENKLVVFRLSDILNFFENFDKHWIQINQDDNLACVSNEGITYEPKFIGKIINEK